MTSAAPVRARFNPLAASARIGAGRGSQLLPFALPAIAVGVLAGNNGGYFPQAWGWSGLAFAWVAGVALILGAARLSALELGQVGALLALSAWIGLSISWSTTGPGSVLELERVIVYPAGVLAALLVARRRTATELLAGVLAAISVISAYSLGTRLLPDRIGVFDLAGYRFAGYRLTEPIGYWNALGIFAAMGTLLALGLSTRTQRPWLRALAAGSLLVLLPTLYFTFSRGSWIALGIALLAMIALDPRRLQFITSSLIFLPTVALALFLASRSDALTHAGSPLQQATSEGHRLLLWIGVLGLVNVGLAFALAYIEKRVKIGDAARRASGATLLAALVVSLVVVFAHYGTPPTLVRKAYNAFTSTSTPSEKNSADLNKRLLILSSGRTDVWHAAWEDYKEHPWLGSGAGSYEAYWNQHRPNAAEATDAHSLYLETLAELGPIGLMLVLAALGIPLIAAAKARRHPLVPAALGTYLAYVVHAGGDWDWEMTAVTLTALTCGTAILAAARADEEPMRGRSRARVAALLLALGVGAFSLVGLLGNRSLDISEGALAAHQLRKAEAYAHEAIRWAPWSADAWRQLGWAQMGKHDKPAARASFERAIAKDPQNYDLWLSLAFATTGSEQRRALVQVRRLNPLLDLRSEFFDIQREH